MISFSASEAAPTFDHPLEMLRACHSKILRQCDTLQKLAVHLASEGCDVQAQQAAQAILRYFDTAGQFHHQDEEQDLFPALQVAAGSDKTRLKHPLKALLERLLGEHVIMLASWDALRPTLLQLAAGVQVTLEAAVMDRFITSYTAHIATENAELLPLAAQILSPQQLEKIGRKMSERRGAP